MATVVGASDMRNPRILLPGDLATTIPPLQVNDHPKDPLVFAVLFLPDCCWTWFITEFDSTSRVCFGIVVNEARQRSMRHFSLDDLQLVRSPRGVMVNRLLEWIGPKLASTLS